MESRAGIRHYCGHDRRRDLPRAVAEREARCERAQQLEDLIWKAVQAAEQLFGAGNGAEKKAYVVEYLEARGVDAEAVDADIEAAVLEVNEMVKP